MKVPFGPRGPVAAYDAKPSRRARDDEPEGRSGLDVLMALKERMSPEGFRAMCMALCDDDDAQDGDPASQFSSPMAREMDQAKDRRKAKDAPADFPGKPRTGTAMDGLPDFDRLGRPRATKSDKSFAAMFGQHALDIKTNADPYPAMSRRRV